ncbi:hypothetical protein GGI12_000303 [Dipsacomyces acuminosporus]|nr:hypothetical protein GGI12_000303 [Dipsacomyces acuminosporus]
MSSSTVDLDNPKPEEKAAAIRSLRDRLASEINDYCSDSDIWRFAVARQLDASAEMISEWYKWRQDDRIDDMPVAQADNSFPVPYPTRGYYSVADTNLMAGPKVKEFQLKLNRYFGGGCWHKQDKDGHPVYIERMGRYKIKNIPTQCTMDELFEDHYLMQEFLCRTIFPECSKMAQREISKQVVIFDLSGISIGMLSHLPALNMLREMLSKDQLYYPECMHRTFVINAPSMFVTAWNMIKGWLDPRVISKIQILGKNYSSELLKQIPPYNLPAFLGGTCRCSHMPGGCVPSIPMYNYPDLPRSAFINLQHQVQVSYADPKHSFVYETSPVSLPDRRDSSSSSSAASTGYMGWFGRKKGPETKPDESEQNAARNRIVYLRFSADRGRGMVVEVLWSMFGPSSAGLQAQNDELLVYPETLLDPHRGPVLLELKVPNKAGHLTVNWRIANLDEGLAPFPSAEEAQVPISLEYSIDTEEGMLKEFSLPAINRDA